MNLTKAIAATLLALGVHGSTASAADGATRCSVVGVRRLNVSNGIEVRFQIENSCALAGMRIVNASEGSVNQLTTIATAALVNSLPVEISFDTSSMNCRQVDWRTECTLSAFTGFGIVKSE